MKRIAVPATWRIRTNRFNGLRRVGAIYYRSAASARRGRTARPIIFRLSIWSAFCSLGFGLAHHARRLGQLPSTTFQEAIRRRWMTRLLGFAVVMLGVSTFFTWMQPGRTGEIYARFRHRFHHHYDADRWRFFSASRSFRPKSSVARFSRFSPNRSRASNFSSANISV